MTAYRLPPRVVEEAAVLRTGDGLRLIGRLGRPPTPVGWAVVCHPDPRQGATMDNKVVTATVRAAAAADLATLRFNFRGVGGSEGAHGAVAQRLQDNLFAQQGARQPIAEQADVRAAMALAEQAAPLGRRVLAGFSFGSAVAACTITAQDHIDVLLLIAPPLAIGKIVQPALPSTDVAVIVGDKDPLCSLAQARDYLLPYGTRSSLLVVGNCEHFFHRRLDVLANHVGKLCSATTWARQG